MLNHDQIAKSQLGNQPSKGPGLPKHLEDATKFYDSMTDNFLEADKMIDSVILLQEKVAEHIIRTASLSQEAVSYAEIERDYYDIQLKRINAILGKV